MPKSASLIARLVKNPPAMQEIPGLGRSAGEGITGGSDSKESAYNAGNPPSIPGSGKSPGKGNGNPLQYSCLENPMGRGAWRATVHGVSESDMTESHTHTHSEDYGLGHGISDSSEGLFQRGKGKVRIHRKFCWKITMQWPTPVFLPGEFQGQGSLVGCRLWGRKELDMTERLSLHFIS